MGEPARDKEARDSLMFLSFSRVPTRITSDLVELSCKELKRNQSETAMEHLSKSI